jgi:hypothetical protein
VVPIEVRAFTLLAVCVMLLAAVLIIQLVPRRATSVDRSLLLVVLALVLVLAIVVLATIRP